jgi:hypothetical protein
MAERETYVERLKSTYLALAHTADVMARDAPPKLRPLLRLAFIGSVSLICIAMAPFFPLVWWKQGAWLKKHEQDLQPVTLLEDSAAHLWTATSHQMAVDTVRDVFERCRSTPGGIVAEPFGRFEWAACGDSLANLLYRYEAQLGHWQKALEIADLMINEKGASEAIFPRWIISRAKCLVRLGRDGEALALLMVHRDLYNPKAPINQSLDDVREGRG